MNDSTELASTAAFFEKVFAGHTGHTVLVTWSGGTFGKGSPVVERWFELPRQLPDMARYVEANSAKDIYFTPFTFTEHKRQKATAKGSPAVYADLDGCPPVNLVCEPTLLWETSPDRHQALWLVDRMETVEAEELSHGVAVHHKDDGCDQGGWDIGQLLRVPGSTHNKRAPHKIAPAKVGPSYTLDDFVDFYEGVEAPLAAPVHSAAREPLPKLPRHIQERLEGKRDEGRDRSKATYVMLALGAQWGLTDGQLLSLLDQHGPTQSKAAQYPTRDWDRLFTNAIAKVRVEHPHSGTRCDEAACKNTPRWMQKEAHDEEEFEMEMDEAGQIVPLTPQVPVSASPVAPEASPAAAVLAASQAPRVTVVQGTPAMEDGWDDDLSSFESEPHLIQNLLEKGTTNWIIGPSGTYKSFIALSMAAAIASAADWYGRETAQGPVIYVCSEGARNWKKRMAAYVKHHGRPQDAEPLMMIPAPVQIGSTEWNALQGTLVAVKPSLVVIDTQAQCATDFEENSNSEMSKVVNALRALSQATGAAVLTVHHSGHDKAETGIRARGASAIPSAADTIITVKPRTDSYDDEKYIELDVTKQKDMEQGSIAFLAPQRIVFEDRLDYYGDPLSSLVLVPYTPSEGGQTIARGTSAEDHARTLIAAGITEPLGLPRMTALVKERGIRVPTGKGPMAKIVKEHKRLLEERA